MGRLGILVNIFALTYTGRTMVFFCFPQYPPVSGDTFNYALPIFAFVVLPALLLWILRAINHWPGLNMEVIDVVLADANRKVKD